MDKFMKEALNEAKRGLKEGGIPIGAMLVRNGKIIGRGHNRRVQKDSPILHAEIDCLQNAGLIKNYKRTVLYSTLMPCYMCSSAIVHFGIKKLVVGESLSYGGTG
jgi:cytosine deaminase